MIRFVLPLLALTGCAGSVSLEEVDGFGAVGSALWVYYDDADAHQIVLTNVVGACGKMQAAYETAKDLQDAAEDLSVNDLDEHCEVLQEEYLAAYRAGDALYHEGAHYLTLQLQDGGDSEPDDQEYEVSGDPAVSGSLVYYENSPGAHYIAEFDPEEDDFYCGADEDEMETDSDVFYLSDGSLEITNVDKENVASGTFEGELDEPGGDNAGDITFSFTATYCEIG